MESFQGFSDLPFCVCVNEQVYFASATLFFSYELLMFKNCMCCAPLISIVYFVSQLMYRETL